MTEPFTMSLFASRNLFRARGDGGIVGDKNESGGEKRLTTGNVYTAYKSHISGSDAGICGFGLWLWLWL
jgi:hypothetical protein